MIDLFEEYNQEGVVVRRTLNGIEVSPDKEPSVVIFRNCRSVTTKKFMTPKEVESIWEIELTDINEETSKQN